MKLPRLSALIIISAVSQPSAAFTPSTGFVRQNGATSWGVTQQAAERMPILMMAQRPDEACTLSVLPAGLPQQTASEDALADHARAANFERVLKGAAIAMAASCNGAAGAMAKYVDPDDVGDVASGGLPPIWLPIVVVGVLSVGIGLLQRSLGDVIDDEARLGSISGARAAKQSARDRNMFKKK